MFLIFIRRICLGMWKHKLSVFITPHSVNETKSLEVFHFVVACLIRFVLFNNVDVAMSDCRACREYLLVANARHLGIWEYPKLQLHCAGTFPRKNLKLAQHRTIFILRRFANSCILLR